MRARQEGQEPCPSQKYLVSLVKREEKDNGWGLWKEKGIERRVWRPRGCDKHQRSCLQKAGALGPCSLTQRLDSIQLSPHLRTFHRIPRDVRRLGSAPTNTAFYLGDPGHVSALYFRVHSPVNREMGGLEACLTGP